VARLLGDQRKRDQTKVALRHDALGPRDVVGIHSAGHTWATLPEEAVQAETAAAMPAGSPLCAVRFEISTHFGSLNEARHMFRWFKFDVTQDISYKFIAGGCVVLVQDTPVAARPISTAARFAP
jgi:hypothetical protein